VWGLAVHAGRLFYSARNGATAEAPQIWSVGIQPDGGFAPDARWELDVAGQPGPYPVSDIAFSQKGAMIVAQRAPIAASYDYSAFTRPGEPRVLRYWPKDPNDPPSPGLWKPMAEEYAIGFAGDYRNADGGVALGYGYGPDGTLGATACEAALWSTGQNLRNDPSLRAQLEPGGPLVVHGLQGSPADLVRDANAPPATSYFIDYDDKFDDPSASGHIGGVRVYATPCAPAVAVSGLAGAAAGAAGGGAGGGGGGGGPPPPPPPNACFASTGTFSCVNYNLVYTLTVTGPGWINTVSAVSLTPGVIVPGGQFPLNPANIPVTGAPGSTAVIEICAFNAAAAASGNPYDCCHATVTVTLPNRSCEILLK
jgi:hypothetical protein